MILVPANILSVPINISDSKKILGIDESGKGDFFGPLVIAGVSASGSDIKRLESNGIRDSKKMSDNRVLELSRWLRNNFVHSIVIIGPEKYNQLYDKIKNLNKLLAWGHSRVIENIAAGNKIDMIISDKFGREDFIEKALMKYGRGIELHQMIKGETVAQVAAASIVARAAFIDQMDKLSSQYEIILPKGAGTAVDNVARELVGKFGKEILTRVAKIHFKNYRKVLGNTLL